jgi:hypothetical protein
MPHAQVISALTPRICYGIAVSEPMAPSKQSYPVYFPADCPPLDAFPASHSVFRLMTSVPPQVDDLVSMKVQRPDDAFGSKSCQAFGLSVYLALKDARRQRRRFGPGRTWRIGSTQLHAAHGVLKATPPNEARVPTK